MRLLTNTAESIFAKSYLPIYTIEIFQVDRICNNSKPTVYYLRDLNGELIKGMVYRQELKECTVPFYFDIESILETRINTKTGKKEFLIKYKGYPDTFNEWVNENSLTPI